MTATATATDRRTIIGAGALLAGAVGGPAGASMTGDGDASAPGARWQPAMEPQDAWLDKPGTRHRMVADTSSATAAQSALFVVDNFYKANKSGYGLDPAALGVAIVLRHMSTPLGYNDAIWAKYGAHFAEEIGLKGALAIAAAKRNPLLTADDPKDKDATTIASLAAIGTIFPVCGMATQGAAAGLAKKLGGDKAAIEKELRANLVPGGVMVAAGVVAINRAQEHGYSFCYVPE